MNYWDLMRQYNAKTEKTRAFIAAMGYPTREQLLIEVELLQWLLND